MSVIYIHGSSVPIGKMACDMRAKWGESEALPIANDGSLEQSGDADGRGELLESRARVDQLPLTHARALP